MKYILTFFSLFLVFNLNAEDYEHLIYNSIEGGGNTENVVAMVSKGNRIYTLLETDSGDLFTSENAYQKDLSFLNDLYVKIYEVDFDEVSVIAATYYGTQDNDTAVDIAVNEDDEIIICGYTRGSDFNETNTLTDNPYSGQYSFITVLNPDLSSVVSASIVGGNGDDRLTSIGVKSDGSIYFGGETTSSNLKTSSLAHKPDYESGIDGFYGITNRNGTSLTALSYFGGTSDDYVADVVMEDDDLYILCGTNSSGITTHPRNGFGQWRSTPYKELYEGGIDLMVGKFEDGGTVEYLTYFGGSQDDVPASLVVSNGTAYFSGTTASTKQDNFDYQDEAALTDNVGGTDMFFAVLPPLQTITQFNFSRSFQEIGVVTALGSRGNETCEDMFFDPDLFQFVLVGSTDFRNFPITEGEGSYGDDDGLVIYIPTSGAEIEKAFFLGGPGNDVTTAVSNIKNALFFATNVEESESITKTWTGISERPDGTNDFVISRYSDIGVRINNPSNGEEFCRDGATNVSFNRLNDIENLEARITMSSEENPDDVIIYNDDQIIGDNLLINFDEAEFDSEKYIVKVALANGSNAVLEDGITFRKSPVITSVTLEGTDETNTICENAELIISASTNEAGNNFTWFLDNKVIESETSGVLNIAEISLDQEGSYRVEYSGECAPDAESETFDIFVTENPKNFAPLDNITVDEGDPLAIETEVDGENLEYQWYKDGELILGEEASSLTFSSINSNNAGEYYAKAYNDCSEIESNTFVIDVNSTSVRNRIDSEHVYISGNTIVLESDEGLNQESINVVDLTGASVQVNIVSNGSSFIIEGISQTGVYFVIVSAENPRTYKVNYIGR
jgi:hypothetical protein